MFALNMQIQPCPIKSTHPWERCCYAHPHENARRRDPRQYRYIAEPCPDYKRGICLLVRLLTRSSCLSCQAVACHTTVTSGGLVACPLAVVVL